MLFEHIAISCDLLAAQHGCCLLRSAEE